MLYLKKKLKKWINPKKKKKTIPGIKIYNNIW
jgi:hypothetical protein